MQKSASNISEIGGVDEIVSGGTSKGVDTYTRQYAENMA
jgi:hypothetical protein